MKLQQIIIILFILFSLGAEGQNMLVLEKPGRMKNHKYSQNDHIRLKTIKDIELSGTIQSISDTSITILPNQEVKLKEIAVVYRQRWGYTLLQTLCVSSGLLYVSINGLNGVINNDSPVVPKETLIISGSLIAAGILLTPLTTRKHFIDNENWRLMILDFTFETE